MEGRARTSPGMSVGSSSILMIFVVLMLTTFAALSLVSANADRNLARRVADNAQAYYAADSRAEEITARVAEAVRDGVPASGLAERADAADASLTVSESGRVSFALPVGDAGKSLEAVIDVSAGLADGGATPPEILRWQVVVDDSSWEDAGNSLPLLGSGEQESCLLPES